MYDDANHYLVKKIRTLHNSRPVIFRGRWFLKELFFIYFLSLEKGLDLFHPQTEGVEIWKGVKNYVL